MRTLSSSCQPYFHAQGAGTAARWSSVSAAAGNEVWTLYTRVVESMHAPAAARTLRARGMLAVLRRFSTRMDTLLWPGMAIIRNLHKEVMPLRSRRLF
jgi:hypothetical protein